MPITSILTTIWTELDESYVAICVIVIDAEENRVIDVVGVIALPCRFQRSIDLVVVVAWWPWFMISKRSSIVTSSATDLFEEAQTRNNTGF